MKYLKLVISFMSFVLLLSAGASAKDVPASVSPSINPAVIKWRVKNEVEKRERAHVIDVQIVEPGIAKVRYEHGTATVRFGFNDPIMNCQLGLERECEKTAYDNPLGFKVLSYESGLSK